jgi:uracil-DNA glycosylase
VALLCRLLYKISADLGVKFSKNGDLTPWAEQGVLLLNATLTVEQAQAGSHQNKGWEQFTDAAIAALNMHRAGLVFVLWGSYAQKKGAFIDDNKHLVLKSVHPSPLSAHRGFFGNHQFSNINTYLISQGQTPINWQL